MFTKIMAPVDLTHANGLQKAMRVAAELAGKWNIPVCYVGVTAAVPGPVAHDPKEFAAKLEAFGRAEAQKYGHQATTRAYTSHDPTSDMNTVLLRAIDDTGSDLVVMASHEPGMADYLFSSHGGAIASHASASVFLVR